MQIDKKLARLLSEIFLDLTKAFFIAVFLVPSFTSSTPFLEALLILTKNLFVGTLSLLIAWKFAKLEEEGYGK